MSDMYDCGRSTHDSAGSGRTILKMSVAEVQRLLEHDRLTDDAQRRFERGFLDARRKANE